MYDKSYTFYLSHASTRGLSVCYHDGKFVVRLLDLSTRWEWEFAFQMLTLAAGNENALVETDWEPAILRVADLRKEFDIKRIGDRTRSILAHYMNLVVEEDRMIGLPGPVSDFWLGPQFLSRVCAKLGKPDIDDILEMVFSTMLIVNYFNIMPAFADFHSLVETIEQPDGKPHYAAHIEPGKLHVVPLVGSLVIMDPEEGRTTILSADFKELVGGFFREQEELVWLDEFQFMIGPIDAERLASFVQFVRTHQSK